MTLKFVHVLVLTIEWSYYVHGTNKIILSYKEVWYIRFCYNRRECKPLRTLDNKQSPKLIRSQRFWGECFWFVTVFSKPLDFCAFSKNLLTVYFDCGSVLNFSEGTCKSIQIFSKFIIYHLRCQHLIHCLCFSLFHLCLCPFD